LEDRSKKNTEKEGKGQRSRIEGYECGSIQRGGREGGKKGEKKRE